MSLSEIFFNKFRSGAEFNREKSLKKDFSPTGDNYSETSERKIRLLEDVLVWK
jgi:hypothetical protein